MRYTPIVLATLLLMSAACSNDERETSFVPEAQAAAPQPKDYGWRTPPRYPAVEQAVHEYQ